MDIYQWAENHNTSPDLADAIFAASRFYLEEPKS
jgi:hypothetical protein